MKVHALVARFGKAGESDKPMDAAREILESLRGQVEAIENLLGYISGTGGNAGRCFTVRRKSPHNHGTWATILQLSGEEKNTLYQRENGRLQKVGEMILTRGAILPMPAETIHVVQCRSHVPAIGPHVYGGDIFTLARRMWNPETLEEHALDWALYEKFAQTASKAANAPLES